MNVLSNAVKFTPKEGHICLSVSQRPLELNRIQTIIQVTDTGIGISDEFQKKIFDSFTQECGGDSGKPKGTGLGMAISYHLMRQMGGNIRVESKLGSGSTFTIEFPAKVIDEMPHAQGVEPAIVETNAIQTKQLNVLLAEDNELNAEIIT